MTEYEIAMIEVANRQADAWERLSEGSSMLSTEQKELEALRIIVDKAQLSIELERLAITKTNISLNPDSLLLESIVHHGNTRRDLKALIKEGLIQDTEQVRTLSEKEWIP